MRPDRLTYGRNGNACSHSQSRAPGSASAPSQMQNVRHTRSASRQLPLVMPSTNSGAISVQPRTNSVNSNQGGM